MLTKHQTVDDTWTWRYDFANGGENTGDAEDLGFLKGATITSASVTTDTGLTKTADSNTQTTVDFTVSGDTIGGSYECKIQITLSTGESFTHYLKIVIVKEL